MTETSLNMSGQIAVQQDSNDSGQKKRRGSLIVSKIFSDYNSPGFIKMSNNICFG